MSESGMTQASASGEAGSPPTFESLANKFVKSSGEEGPTEIIVDGKKLAQPFTDADSSFLKGLKNLKKLSMNACKIKTFRPLVLPEGVVSVEAADNILSDGELDFLKDAKDSIKSVNVGNNPLKTLDGLKVLTELPSLETLDIEGTPIDGEESTAKWCWENLKSLKVLNRKDKDGNEIADDDEEDEFDDEGSSEDDEDDDDDDDDEDGEDGKDKVDLKKFYEGGDEMDEDDEDDFQPDEDEDAKKGDDEEESGEPPAKAARKE